MALPKYRLPRRPQVIDIEDYLFLDKHSVKARYEYLDGELVMLAGGSRFHSVIKSRLSGEFHVHLKKSPCWVFDSDIRLQLSESRYVYPDIAVGCDPRDHTGGDDIHYPRLVVEALSPSTRHNDRGKKFFYYQDCPTIQEYVMVDTLSVCIEVYRREDGWLKHEYGPGDTVRLESIKLDISVDDLYWDLELPGKSKSKKKK